MTATGIAPETVSETLRDLVVVGASAGGIEAVQRLIRDLGDQRGAAVLVVVHMSPDMPSALPSIIARCTPMTVVPVFARRPIEAGTIYVAQPDLHMLVEDGYVVASRGPRENRHRPSIDALFRSAASEFGPRVVGVVLSGNLRDGAAGLDAIDLAGGVAVVEDPADASYTGMPLAAMSAVPEASVVRLAKMGHFLSSLLPDVVAPGGRPMAAYANPRGDGPAPSEQHPPSRYTCPDCGGTLFRVDDAGERVMSFHCRVGHRYSSESLFEAQDDAVEDALWASLRAMEERIDLADTLATRARDSGREHATEFFGKKAGDARRRADALRALLNESSLDTSADSGGGDE